MGPLGLLGRVSEENLNKMQKIEGDRRNRGKAIQGVRNWMCPHSGGLQGKKRASEKNFSYESKKRCASSKCGIFGLAQITLQGRRAEESGGKSWEAAQNRERKSRFERFSETEEIST